ncbi:hypothetical protein [Chromobacterium sphagni]|uniref:Uncharacterized protein n=1 Tax=Chromobacterium sphagni TaxID=1903179 RepID=A0ABX3CEQ3_9NEIS|nr:hypothetical protein [Chromobacterium sphagni]OHX20782.1 hypothetical protein BI344_14165 [Chromobacterium sphagni]
MVNSVEGIQADASPHPISKEIVPASAKSDFHGLISLVQMRYGLTRDEAEKQVRIFLETCESGPADLTDV